MIRKLNRKANYKKLISFKLCIYLLLTFATSSISYFFLPFAVGMLASLFLFELPQKRIFSYIAPIAATAISAFISVYEVITVALVAILALILALCYAKRKSKALCCLYLCSAFIFYLFAVFFFYCVSRVGFDFNLILAEMSAAIDGTKIKIADYIQLMLSNMNNTSFAISITDAEAAVNSIFELWPTVIFVLAFTVSGVAIKFFTHLVARNCRYGILKSFLAFSPATLVAVFYIITYVISMLSYGNDVFTVSISHISTSLMVVFAYMGFKYITAISRAYKRQRILLFIAIGVLLFAPSVGIALLSYVGAYVTVIFNRQQNP